MKNKYGIFDLKDGKLVKRADMPIKYKSGGKTHVVKPDNALYDTIAYYSVKQKPYEL